MPLGPDGSMKRGLVEKVEKKRRTLQSFSCMEKTQITSTARMRKGWKEWRMGGLNHTVWVWKIKMSQHESSTQYFCAYPHISESLKDVVIADALIYFFFHSKTGFQQISSHWIKVVIWHRNISLSLSASRGINKVALVFSTRLDDFLRKQIRSSQTCCVAMTTSNK